MGLIPTGEPGKILQWYDSGGGVMALRNATMSDVVDRLISNVPIVGERYYFDAANAGVAAAAQPFMGSGALASVLVSGGAGFSAAAVEGAGSLGDVAVTGGTPSTFGAPAVQGTGEIGDAAAAGGAGMSAAAWSGTGELAGVAVTGSVAGWTENFAYADGALPGYLTSTQGGNYWKTGSYVDIGSGRLRMNVATGTAGQETTAKVATAADRFTTAGSHVFTLDLASLSLGTSTSSYSYWDFLVEGVSGIGLRFRFSHLGSGGGYAYQCTLTGIGATVNGGTANMTASSSSPITNQQLVITMTGTELSAAVNGTGLSGGTLAFDSSTLGATFGIAFLHTSKSTTLYEIDTEAISITGES